MRFLIDTCISIMQQRAVNATKVNWPVVKQTALTMAKGIDNPAQLGSVMRYLYKSVDDYHGAFFYKDSTFRWTKNQRVISDSIMNEWKKGVVSITKVFAGNVGYLRIPSMPISKEEDFNTKAQSLNDSLCSLLSRNVKGIILDLRLNGGGAMHPMILGVHNLLQSGLAGAFYADKKQNWVLSDTSFSVDGVVISKITPKCTIDGRAMPVVLLIGPGTGSSGEFLIIPFRNRPNTKLLGTTTAGLVTAVTGIPVNDTAFMNLSVSYGGDRTGKVYKTAFSPDILVDSPDKFNDLEHDEKVQAAVNWIQKQLR